jgi:hypothetical protein
MYNITTSKIQEEMETLQKKMPTLCNKMKEMTSEYFEFSGDEVFKIYAILNILYSQALSESASVSVYDDIYKMISWCEIAVSDEDEMGCMIKYYKDSYGKTVIVA